MLNPEKMAKLRGLTLLELIVALILFSLLVLAFGNLHIFGHYHLFTSARRSQVQNQVALVLEHMAKQISGTADRGGAIGDSAIAVSRAPIAGANAIEVWVDADKDGRRDDADDKRIAYSYNATSRYEIRYYDNFADAASANITITDFNNALAGNSYILPDFSSDTTQPTYVSYSPVNNYLEVQVTGCWDPASAATCGSPDNPQAKMRARIKMPSVSSQK